METANEFTSHIFYSVATTISYYFRKAKSIKLSGLIPILHSSVDKNHMSFMKLL